MSVVLCINTYVSSYVCTYTYAELLFIQLHSVLSLTQYVLHHSSLVILMTSLRIVGLLKWLINMVHGSAILVHLVPKYLPEITTRLLILIP